MWPAHRRPQHFQAFSCPNWAHNKSAGRAMISGASLKRGDCLVEPLFHPSDYGRPNPSILDRRRDRALRFLARRAELRRAECFCTCATATPKKIFAPTIHVKFISGRRCFLADASCTLSRAISKRTPASSAGYREDRSRDRQRCGGHRRCCALYGHRQTDAGPCRR